MKRISFLVLGLTLAILLAGCEAKPPESTETGTLRYDGMYCFIRDFDYNGLTNNYALRFYEDGTVIHTSVEQKAAGMNYFPKEKWFNRENGYYGELLGSYTVSGGEITLTTKAPEGSVYYKGTIGRDRLVLDSRSEINGFEMSGCVYVFYPFED